MENMGYGRKRLKDFVEKETVEEGAKEQQQGPAAAKEQQQYDDEQYGTVPKIKLVYEGKRSKEFRVTWNLNGPNTKIIMANITPQIEMRTKVIYSFKSEIHRGADEIAPYYKTLTSRPLIYKFGGDSSIY